MNFFFCRNISNFFFARDVSCDNNNNNTVKTFRITLRDLVYNIIKSFNW